MYIEEDGKPRARVYIHGLVHRLRCPSLYVAEARHLLDTQLDIVRQKLIDFWPGIDEPLEQYDLDETLAAIAHVCSELIAKHVDERMQERMLKLVQQWEARMRELEGLVPSTSS